MPPQPTPAMTSLAAKLARFHETLSAAEQAVMTTILDAARRNAGEVEGYGDDREIQVNPWWTVTGTLSQPPLNRVLQPGGLERDR